MLYDLLIVGGVAIAGVILILLLIWFFVFGRSFSALVLTVIGIFFNDQDSFDEDAPIEPDNEQPLSEIITHRAEDIPFDVQLPDVHVAESMPPSRETQATLRVPGAEQPVRPQIGPKPEGEREFLKMRLETGEQKRTNQPTIDQTTVDQE
ncbi:MAG: hypothetical protein CL607_20580 [Anaerolineaceae bacterium]|nr:hypothetical protein [Anaerolineaceae bacterium]